MGHVTPEQRYKIETYRTLGKGITEIADYIKKDKSVVSKEIKRNSDGRSGIYKADLAHRKTTQRHQIKTKKYKFTREAENHVLHYLEQDFSPEQIAGRAAIEGKEMVSHERIYQYIWKDKRNGGKLHRHLSTKGKRYRKRAHAKDSRGLIPWLHTMTSDNGKEFANHQQLSEKLGIDYFFAKPYPSWERGANENFGNVINKLNCLLLQKKRYYIPKKSYVRIAREGVTKKMAATLQGFNNGVVNPAKSIFNWRINILWGKAALKIKL
jgi:IS30 family transposase